MLARLNLPLAASAAELVPINVGHINNGSYAWGVAVSSDYAYLANDSDGLRVINISNPQQPAIVGHGTNGGSRALHVALAGSFAYLANYTNGLRIYDISNSTNPVQVGHAPRPNVLVSAAAGHVAVTERFAYLANDADGLRIYDVANPANPVNVGHIDISGQIWGVAVTNNYVYLAATWQGLRIFDVSSPTNPVSVAQVNPGDAALGVTVSGQHVYLACGSGGVRIYDIASPVNPVQVASVNDGGEAWRVTVAGRYAYLANGADGMRIYDVANPTNPVPVGHVADPGHANEVAVSGDYALLANSSDGLRIYRIDRHPGTNCAPRPAGLVAWWPGDGSTLDVVGSSHGILQNGAAFGGGIAGAAFRLDGVNDHIRIPASSSLDVGLGAGFTLDAWIKANATNQSPIFEWNSGTSAAGTRGVHFWISVAPPFGSGAGCLYANVIDTLQAGHYFASGPGLVRTNTFQHVAMTFTKATGQATLFFNGRPVGQMNLGAFTPLTSGNLFLGFRPGSASFNGLIDEATVHERALASNEVLAIYQAGRAGKCFADDPAPVFLRHPQSQIVFEARTAILEAFAMGVPRPDNQWLFNGTPILGATNISLVLSNVALGQAGGYALVASNSSGSVPSLVATLQVIEDFNLSGKSDTNCATVSSGLVGWWPADGFRFDVVGTNHATLFNGAAVNIGVGYSAGKVGNAFDFDGANDVAALPPSSFLHSDTALTLATWFKADTLAPTWQCLISKGSNDDCQPDCTDREFALWINAQGYVLFTSTPVDGVGISSRTLTTLPGSISTGRWHHVAGVIDSAAGTMALYLDGALAVTGAYSLSGIRTSVGWLHFGAAAGGSGWFNGALDEITLFNRALNANEIAPIYATGSAGMCYTNDPAPLFVIHPLSQLRYVGATVVLEAAAMGVPRPSGYQWYLDGATISGATNPVYSIPSIQPFQFGSYTVGVSNTFGAAHSEPGEIIQRQLLVANGLVAYWPFDGNANDFSGNGRHGVVSGAVLTHDRTRQPDSAYRFDGVNDRIAIGSRVKPPFPLSILAWTKGRGTIFSNDRVDDTSYRWGIDFEAETSYYGFTSFSGFAAPWTRYGVRSQAAWTINDGGWHHVAAIARAHNNVQWFVDGEAVSSVYWHGEGTGMQYSSDGVGYIGVTLPFGSDSYYRGDLDEIRVYNRALTRSEVLLAAGISELPVITVFPYTAYVPLGETAMFTAAVRGGDPYPHYQWNFNGANIVDETNATLLINDAQTNRSGTYTVVGSNSFGCVSSSLANLTVVPPPLILVHPQSQSWPLGYPVALSVSATSITPVSYQWQKDGTNLPGATGVSYAIASLQTNHVGVYSVTVSNLASVVFSSNAILNIREPIWNNPERFDLGWSDWQTDNAALWQIGVPTAGPPLTNSSRAYSPTNCAATLLSANYTANSQGRLLTSLFIVPAVAGDARVLLRWWQYYQYGTGDAGLVEISTPYETNWTTLAIAATNGTSGTWTPANLDLTPYQGQQVRLAFRHIANNNTSVGAGWFIDDVSLSQSVPTRLALDMAATNRFTANRQGQYFVVTVPAGGHLRVMLDSLANRGINELYVRRGALPSAGAYDFRYSTNGGADQSIFVPNADAGDWFVLAYNDSGPVPGDYTLQVQFSTGVILDRLTPTSLGSVGPALIAIHGAGFTPGDWVQLTGPATVPATNVSFISAGQLLAEFPLAGVAAGQYQLTVTNGTGSASLPFEITQGVGPKLHVRVIPPSRIGYHNRSTITIEYANRGDTAMPAPLLTLTLTQNGRAGAILTLNRSIWTKGFWTRAIPQGFSTSIQILADGAVSGLLQPGESRSVPVYYAGWLKPWDFQYRPIYFSLRAIETTSTTRLDWAAFEDGMRPLSIPQQAWDAIWENFLGSVGTTWGEYVAMLSENASYLGRLGIDVSDVSDLLAFEFAQADALNVIGTLASATDAFARAPGLDLTFTRTFGQTVSSRNRVGDLGYGWRHNWACELSEAADGTVTIGGCNGGGRVFQPDSRNTSRYFASPGDTGVLTPRPGGGFLLTEADGLTEAFGANGLREYRQDANGNRITTTYSGNQLTRLIHSSGQFLNFTWNGSGLLQSVSDSHGRTTTYTFDGAQHLISVQNFDGSVVAYDYLTGATAPRNHALANIAYPGGTHLFFTYDARGRLASAYRDGNAELINFAYDNAGRVSVTDALHHTTQYYLEHRGLLTRVTDPQGDTTRLAFSEVGNLHAITDPADRSYHYQYDDEGNLTRILDPFGHSTRFAYTGPFNRMTRLTDANGNVTQYAYSPVGNLTSITYPDGSRERWSYDGSGNPITWTNRRGQPIAYHYNFDGQLDDKQLPGDPLTEYAYDARGNLILATNKVGPISMTYFPAGHPHADKLRRITYPGGQWLEYTYHPSGQRASMLDQLGHRLDYHYDTVGRIKRISNELGTNIVAYAYDMAGRLGRKTLGNGLYTNYSYDEAGQLLDLHNHAADNSTLSRFQYTYDSGGRRVSMATSYSPTDSRTTNGLAGTWTYAYDDIGQLIAWDSPDGTSARYVYDALGNRITETRNGVVTTYRANLLNQCIQSSRLGNMTTYRYDLSGNLTNVSSEGTQYSFTAEDQLAEVTGTNWIWQYSHNALGLLSATFRVGATIHFVTDPIGFGNLLGEYDDSAAVLSRHDYGFGLLTSTSSGHLTDYYTFDANGSTAELVDSQRANVRAYVYAPFGEELGSFSGGRLDLRFLGEHGVQTEDNGVCLTRARVYSPGQGRFLSPDPLGLGGWDINLYRYAANSPETLIDPIGLQYFNPYMLYPLMNEIDIVASRLVTAGVNSLYRLLPLWNFLSAGAASQIPGTVPQTKEELFWFGIDQWDALNALARDVQNANIWVNEALQDSWMDLLQDVGLLVGQVVSDVVRPFDPNEKYASGGSGSVGWIAGDGTIPCQIGFENLASAQVPAQIVTIADPVSTNLDWSTFELKEIAFGDHVIPVAPGSQRFEWTEPVTMNGVGFVVQIDAGIRLSTGEVYANFYSIDPVSGLPPETTTTTIGFLPPNLRDADGNAVDGRGEGHIAYTIKPKAGLPTGTEIRNVAFIMFDGAATFRTDLVDPTNSSSGINSNKQALVTIDADAPTSVIDPLPAIASSTRFDVAWSGSDLGAGITGFDVYVQTNGGAWVLWLANTTDASARFHGRNNTPYCFYSIARDGTGQAQPTNTAAVVCTTTPLNSPPWFLPPSPTNYFVISVNQTLIVTNAASDPDYPAQGLAFSLANPPAGAGIHADSGVLRWTPDCAQGNSTNTITVVVTDDGTPAPLSATTNITVVVHECVETSLGGTAMLAGSSNAVAIRLLSTVELTNLSFTVGYPASRLTNFSLGVDTQQVSAPLLIESNGRVHIALTLPGNRVLHGPTNVGELGFTALAGQSSDFVPLVIRNIEGLKPNGSPVANAIGNPGRVVVVGLQPLLEALHGTNGTIQVILYAEPGTTNRVESTSELGNPNAWRLFGTYASTNIVQPLPPISATSRTLFLRAVRQP